MKDWQRITRLLLTHFHPFLSNLTSVSLLDIDRQVLQNKCVVLPIILAFVFSNLVAEYLPPQRPVSMLIG